MFVEKYKGTIAIVKKFFSTINFESVEMHHGEGFCTWIDYMGWVGDSAFGLQIKPVNSGIQLPEIFKEYNLQAATHEKFTEVFGGKVFYLFSAKVGDKKEIQNKEVIDEIRAEIERLTSVE